MIFKNFYNIVTVVAIGILMILATSCSSTRYVPDGKYLLDDVKVRINDTTGTLTEQQMLSFVRQRPNNKFFYLAKLRLGVYNMSGSDSTSKWNRWIRSLGEPPVIYDPEATATDAAQLLKAMSNAGFLGAKVEVDSFPRPDKKKIRLVYNLDAGEPHVITSINYVFPNDTMRNLVMRDSARFPVQPGQRLDRTMLEVQREWITGRLQNRGYWAFNKQFITFSADTTKGSHDVNLTMTVRPPRTHAATPILLETHKRYIVKKVKFLVGYDPATTIGPRHFVAADSVTYRDIEVLYADKKHLLRPSTLYDCCYIRAGEPYSEHHVSQTYSALSRMQILKFTNIQFMPAGEIGDTGLLDAYIMLTSDRSQSVSIELEGTNSEGDLGAALGLNYSHRNIGHGGEILSARIRASYEAISGDLAGFINNRATEYSLDLGLTFPKFEAPLLKESFKRRINATTSLQLSMNYQERPEYTRIISTIGWNYKWSERRSRYRYQFTPIDINYVYLPKSTNNFIDQIAPDNPLLRYSYQDHFIMRAGFNFYYTDKRTTSPWNNHLQRNVFTVRANAEIAGNLLFALSKIINPRRNFSTSPYKIFGIHYSQYVKAEGELNYLHSFNRRHALAGHIALGVGVPYGNSTILPFEKRFYGGGANGVRGWTVRTLGPGRFPTGNSVNDFINQCGDIRMEASLEYRAKLFWVIEGALFMDAGNIWTIRDYETQPHGTFHFNSFYKEFATAYGIGVRFDFSYFLLRFDLGMKAHNPAINREPWPLIHPKWGRDHAFHFSIGYPF